VVNVALPAIDHELGGGLVTQQWVVDAYLITLGALMLVAGSLSDVFGRRRILAWGLAGFGVASVLCAVASTRELLIVARGLQGAAGALLVPSSLAIIIARFSGEAQGKAIGSWTAWTGISFLVGPLLGGWLVDTASWRWVFGINVLPIALTLWLLSRLDWAKEQRGKRSVDMVGAVLCTIGLGAPVFALIEQARLGWANPWIWGTLVVGLASLAAFVRHERRAKDPMLPLELFAVRNFSVGNLATVAIYSGLSVATFLIVIFLQQVGHYSALQAGMALLPVTVIMFTLSSRFGALAGKFGPRWFMGAGPVVAGLGFLLLLRVDASASYVTQVLPGILVFGLGLATTVAPLTSAVLGSIRPEHAGVGSAVNNAVARVAGLIAIAAIGVVIGTQVTTAGFHRGTLVMAGLLVAGGLISAWGIQNQPGLSDTAKPGTI
jgi:EmrB/QacA subfamily drug resistance transporter